MENKTILNLLKNEHKKVKSLFKKAQDCKNSERSEILSQIEEELVPHARGEEKTIYSLLNEKLSEKEDKEAKDLVNESYEEHRVVDELMADLKKCDTNSDKWLAHLTVIKENVEHHIKEEEEDLFDKIRKHFSSDELEGLKDSYLKVKESYGDNLPNQSQILERRPAAQARQTMTH